jgi:hypothetical protein
MLIPMSASYPRHSRQSIADAKAQLTIHYLWRHFGFPGESKPSCHSPFREDRDASFSVNADGSLFHDFATGESGDAVDFFRHASGLSRKEACRKFIELAGGHFTTAPCAARPRPKTAARRPSFPPFRAGKAVDLKTLANLRNVSPDAVSLANVRGLLKFAMLKGANAWIITDAARVNAQGRRMDGQLWPDISAKAWTLPGSWASWPIGTKESRDFANMALVEGGPDLLAACHFILCERRENDCAPVAILGATQRIHADALPMFAGKRIRIFGHDDNEGREAVERWARQLETVGADVDAFSFAGLRQADESAVKDLNDCTFIHPDDFETERTLWNLLP